MHIAKCKYKDRLPSRGEQIFNHLNVQCKVLLHRFITIIPAKENGEVLSKRY